jgi:hypothetical protein
MLGIVGHFLSVTADLPHVMRLRSASPHLRGVCAYAAGRQSMAYARRLCVNESKIDVVLSDGYSWLLLIVHCFAVEMVLNRISDIQVVYFI